MAKDERLYARFDIAMDEHPKVMLLSDAAFRTLFEATFYSRRQLTDGFLAEGVVRRRWDAEAIAELQRNDPARPSLYPFEKEGVAGLMIHDYEKHQTTTADINAKRDAGRLGGLAKAKRTPSTSVAKSSEVLEQKGKQNASAPLAITETETETPIAPKREHTLPDGWKPNSNCATFAESNRLDIAFQAEQFKARALADGKKFKDWDAAFRYWLGNAVKWRKPGDGGAPASKAMSVAELVAHRERVMNGGS